jgi:hypothetical protein
MARVMFSVSIAKRELPNTTEHQRATLEVWKAEVGRESISRLSGFKQVFVLARSGLGK